MSNTCRECGSKKELQSYKLTDVNGTESITYICKEYLEKKTLKGNRNLQSYNNYILSFKGVSLATFR